MKIKEDKIYGKLQSDLKNFQNDVTITEDYQFNFSDTLNLIELYLASKFKSGSEDSQGNKKYFYNLIVPQCGHVTKNIDLNRKEIKVLLTGKKDATKAVVYQAELDYWMREHNFGKLLNKISDSLPKYGSVVLKKVGNKVKLVPLRYLKFDPAVSNSPDNYDLQSPYVIQTHIFQPMELEAMKDRGWNEKKVDNLIENSLDDDNSEIKVYEYFSLFRGKDIGLKNKGLVKAKVFIGETRSKSERNERKETISGTVLYSEKIDKFPFKKLDFFTIEGRALGRGIAETLFDIQERWNGMANNKALAMNIGNKQIFQSADPTLSGNILTDVLNGDIIEASRRIERIPTEERNLGAYAQEEGNMLYHVRSLANAEEIITGENLPSRTPFRSAAMQLKQAAKLFDVIRQNEGMFLEEVLTEWIIPTFEKDIVKEHIFEMFDADDIEKIVEDDVDRRLNEATKKYVLREGFFPNDKEIDAIRSTLLDDSLTEDVKFAKVLEGIMDFDKTLQVDITGEKTDTQAEVETGINFLQLLSQNERIQQDPELMKMLKEIAVKSGINPMSLPRSKKNIPSQQEMGEGGLNPNTALPKQAMPKQPSNQPRQ